MAAHLEAVGFDARDAAACGAFWAGLLDRTVVDEDRGVLLPGRGAQVGLRFTEADNHERERNRLHLHVTSESPEDQARRIEAVLGLGGRRRGSGVRPLPIGRDVYLADPDGNEFCLIAPGNTYLAGTGLLGEVTCDGSPAAGRFWSKALSWPLLWDQDEQTVIQSPEGGTKIAWDGARDPAAAPGTDRQRFELVAVHPQVEAERLEQLGATFVDQRDEIVAMIDPDGSAFSVRSFAR